MSNTSMQGKYFLLLVTCLTSLAFADSIIPKIGTVVRFQTADLDPGWRQGFFNQTRTVPPCYLVMIFNERTSPDQYLRVKETIPIVRLERLQMSTIKGTSMQEWDALSLPKISEETWQEVNIDPLLPQGDNCNFDI